LQRRQPPIEIGVQITLLLAQHVVAILQLFDFAAQLAQLRLEPVDPLRQLQQALIVDDALDASESLIDVVELDQRRVRLRRRRLAAGERQRRYCERQASAQQR